MAQSLFEYSVLLSRLLQKTDRKSDYLSFSRGFNGDQPRKFFFYRDLEDEGKTIYRPILRYYNDI